MLLKKAQEVVDSGKPLGDFPRLGKGINVFDLTGFCWSHAAYNKWHIQMIKLLSAHYPERQTKIFVVNAPFIFRACWAMCKPFLDQQMLDKITFVGGTRAQVGEQLAEHRVSPALLPPELGGAVSRHVILLTSLMMTSSR